MREINVKKFIEEEAMKDPYVDILYNDGKPDRQIVKVKLDWVEVDIDHEHVYIRAEAHGTLMNGKKIEVSWGWNLDFDYIQFDVGDYEISVME